MNRCKSLRRPLLPGREARAGCPIALVLMSFAGLSFAGACAEDDTSGEPVPDPRGGWVFLACDGYLVFDRGSGAEATVVRAPTYAEEFPDEREVARRREEIENFNRSLAELGLEPTQSTEDRLERFRTTPKRYYLSTSQHLGGVGEVVGGAPV